MPGTPGKGGKMPKRSDQRLGHRTKSEQASVQKLEAVGAVEPGALLIEDPHPIVLAVWEAALDSAQSQYYEPSDYAMLNFVLNEMQEYLTGPKRNGQILTSIMGGLNDLMLSEGSRRRVRLEIHRDKNKPEAPVIDMDEMRRAMQGGT